jgi:hypothetical protein
LSWQYEASASRASRASIDRADAIAIHDKGALCNFRLAQSGEHNGIEIGSDNGPWLLFSARDEIRIRCSPKGDFGLRGSARLFGQGIQNEISTLGHTDLRQDRHLIAKQRIHLEQAHILGDRRIKVVTPLGVRLINFGQGGARNTRLW